MATYHPTHNHVVGPCLAGTRVNNKDLVLWRSRFSVLTADSDHWGTCTESGCHCFKPHWLKCLPEDLSSRRTNCTFISLFPPLWRARCSSIRTFKVNHIYRAFRKPCPGKDTGSEKKLRRSQIFTTGLSNAQRHF